MPSCLNEISCIVPGCSSVFQSEEPLHPNARYFCKKHRRTARKRFWVKDNWFRKQGLLTMKHDLEVNTINKTELDDFYEVDWFKKPSPFTKSGVWGKRTFKQYLEDADWNYQTEWKVMYDRDPLGSGITQPSKEVRFIEYSWDPDLVGDEYDFIVYSNEIETPLEDLSHEEKAFLISYLEEKEYLNDGN
jgi:hypothetical protein